MAEHTHAPSPARPPRAEPWRGRAARALLLGFGVALAVPSSGCYTARMKRMEGQLDTLAIQIDTLRSEQGAAIDRIRADLEEQQELLHSLRAGTNVASQDLVDRIGELSAKLDDTVDRFERVSRRSGGFPPPPAEGDTTGGAPPGPGVDATTMYEQAARDFTEGRFELALSEFRALLAAYPTHELADNALYGVGESFYALADYDSARIVYEQVEARYPRGDRVPAALYKLGTTHTRLGHNAEACDSFARLQERYPRSGEANLAGERRKELGCS